MAKKPGKEASGFKFIDDPHAPEFFADAVSGIFFNAGCIRFTFEALKVDNETTPGPVNRVVVGRVILPIAAADFLQKQLAELIERMRAQAAAVTQGTETMQ